MIHRFRSKSWASIILILYFSSYVACLFERSNVTHLHHVIKIGNQLTAVNFYQHQSELSKNVSINITNYYTVFPIGGQNRGLQKCQFFDLWCIKYFHYYFNQIYHLTVWTPKQISKNDKYCRKFNDCQYKLEFVGVTSDQSTGFKVDDNNVAINDSTYNISVKITWVHFHFHIYQNNCSTKLPIYGGSAFSAFGTSFDELTYCKINDLFTNEYTIVCSFLVMENVIESRSCMQLSVLLEYEHYDMFSVALAVDVFTDFYYPPIRLILADNETFCSIHQISPIEMPNLFGNLTSESKMNFDFYTGIWSMSNQQFKPSNHPWKQNLFSAFQYRSATNKLADYSSSTFGILPMKLTSASPSNLADKLVYFPMVLDKNNELWIQNRGSDPISLTTNQMDYHFFGASHMRYTYDAILALLYGESVLPRDKKFSLSHYQNFHYNDVKFAEDIPAQWKLQCDNRFHTDGDTHPNSDYRNRTIIFQFGAWNLQRSPIQILLDSNVLILEEFLETLLLGRYKCKCFILV